MVSFMWKVSQFAGKCFESYDSVASSLRNEKMNDFGWHGLTKNTILLLDFDKKKKKRKKNEKNHLPSPWRILLETKNFFPVDFTVAFDGTYGFSKFR